jgi:hypothetical protein
MPVSDAVPNGRHADASTYFLRQIWPLLMAAAGATALLVWAEEEHHWFAAQACLMAILLLSALVVWAWWHANHTAHQLSVEAAAYNRAIHKLLICVAIGFTGVVLTASRFDHWQDGLVARAIGYGTLVAGSFFVSGVLIGYLFGLRPASVSVSQSSNPRANPHTNLEEIADWLTKLILGAGLVELTNLERPIAQFAKFVATGVDPFPPHENGPQASAAVALSIMCFFAGSGLLYGYFWTRYELAIVSDSEVADSPALALVERWLNQPTITSKQDRVDMMTAVRCASAADKARIFQQTEQYRKPSTREVNDRSLPILEALVEADLQEVFHQYRAGYAMALMGKTRDPGDSDDYLSRALKLLGAAIRIRDRSGEKGSKEYELARAVCKICLDPNFKEGQQSSAVEEQSITADLDSAKDVSEDVRDIVDKDHVLASWRLLNSR